MALVSNASFVNSSFEEDLTISARLYWIYCCEGIFMMIANGLIIGTIMFQEPLRQRKEYIVIAGLALVDLGQGWGLFSAGLIRNLYIIEGTAGKMVSRMSCLMKPWNITFMWSDPLSHYYLFIISVDRFIAVKFPLKYYTFSTRYALYLVSGTYLFMFTCVFVGIMLTLPYTYPELTQFCFTEAAFETNYYNFYIWLAVAADYTSIILYAVVIYLTFKRVKLSDSDQRISALQRHAMAAQRKVTRTLGICSFCMFFFNCLPTMAKIILKPVLGGVIDLLIPYTFVVQQITPISNFFLFTLRQRDLRTGMKNMLKCNRLTEAALQTAAASGAPAITTDNTRLRTRSIV